MKMNKPRVKVKALNTPTGKVSRSGAIGNIRDKATTKVPQSFFPHAIVPEKHVVLKCAPNLQAVKDHPHYPLFQMLVYMRPHDSKTEQQFCDRFIAPIADSQDAFGNYHVVIGANPKVMFSCHTDTVHRQEGFQNLEYDPSADMLYVKESSCLGADDATGIYIMLEMIEAKVEGYYVFHRGEEVGCLGSKWLRDNFEKALVDDLDIAVAFDRAGTEDIIVEQATGLCASDECAEQLAGMLSEVSATLKMRANPNGVVTDTAQYNGLIPECFNLSVGYDRQHSSKESQNLGWLTHFLKACLVIDWHSLIPTRSVDDFGYIQSAYNGSAWADDYAAPSLRDILDAMEDSPLAFAGYLVDNSLIWSSDLDEILETGEKTSVSVESFNAESWKDYVSYNGEDYDDDDDIKNFDDAPSFWDRVRSRK